MKWSSSDSRAIDSRVGGAPAATSTTATSSGPSSARDSRSSRTSGRVLARREAGGPQRRLGAIEIPRLDLESQVAMASECLAVEFLHQAPLMHDPDPRGEPIDLAEDVARHEHGDAVLSGKGPDQTPGSR